MNGGQGAGRGWKAIAGRAIRLGSTPQRTYHAHEVDQHPFPVVFTIECSTE
jgi:hypothetical protein